MAQIGSRKQQQFSRIYISFFPSSYWTEEQKPSACQQQQKKDKRKKKKASIKSCRGSVSREGGGYRKIKKKRNKKKCPLWPNLVHLFHRIV